MTIFAIQPNFWFYWLVFCGIIMAGYFITASSSYYLLNSALGRRAQETQFASKRQENKAAILEDIKLSILSVTLFALAAACFMTCYRRGLTQIYTAWDLKGLGYLIFSYALVLALQDTCFYFTHRLFHLPIFFKWFHRGHHRSRPPTPWTFFAMEPLETAVQSAFLVVITLIIPLHIGLLIAILLTMSVWAVGNHLGFQVIPNSWLSRQLGRWCIGSAHHLVHHQKCTRHYGLYFTFWDKLMGTQDAAYEARRAMTSEAV